MKIYDIPMKLEAYSIASRPLTADELPQIAWKIIDDSYGTYFDTAENHGGPREWPSYEAFLGFHIADAALRFQPDPIQLQEIIKLVYAKAQRECTIDRNNRKVT